MLRCTIAMVLTVAPQERTDSRGRPFLTLHGEATATDRKVVVIANTFHLHDRQRLANVKPGSLVLLAGDIHPQAATRGGEPALIAAVREVLFVSEA
jgi:hypothetical protein